MLAINQLTAGYEKLHIVHDVSLTVPHGQFAGIIGPNGSGKSTLIKSIFGLTRIFGGQILFEGRAIHDLPAEAIHRRGLAYVPQSHNVFAPMTVRENLQLALRGQGKDDARVALAEAYEQFPVLKERHAQRAGLMSGGERQMLAVAMAWLSRPRLMLLDEPSAGLSPRMVGEVFRKLRELQTRGLTLVVVEQNARSLLQVCDYVYIMREGRIALHGTAQMMLADDAIAKRYLGVV